MTEPDLRELGRELGPRVVLFCGGRTCTLETHGDMIRADLLSLAKGSVVLHGAQGCERPYGPPEGADAIADYWAVRVAPQHELHVARVPALWKAYGRGAGPMRNGAMMLFRPDFAFCYPMGGPGTRDMVRRLRCGNVPCVVREAANV